MDTWGIIIFLAGMVAYALIKQPIRQLFLFAGGVGLGILIGAVWANFIVVNAFP